MKLLFSLVLLCGTAFGQAPVLFYSNIITGQCTGGENNKGHWLTLTGQNFGASQDASHYVRFVAVSGGTNYTIDAAAYKYWNYSDPQGNYKITFQIRSGSACLPDGDYDVQVVTPSGTATLPIVYGGTAASPNTHFHIFSGGSFYFADNNNVSCNDAGAGSYSTPYCTVQACTTSAIAAAGNTCYYMPGSTARAYYAVPGYCYGSFANVCGAVGTPDKFISLLGYPTTNFSQTADIGCDYINAGNDCGDATAPTLQTFMSKYIAISNLTLRGGGGLTNTAGRESLLLGGTGYTAHHIRATDIRISNKTNTWILPATFADSSYLTVYGLSFIADCGATNKHEGGIYIGESTNHIDFAWSLVDYGFAITDTTCHVGKQIEIHPTAPAIYAGPPTFGNGNLTATTNVAGQLANGIYDVYVSYYGHNYTAQWNTAEDRESELSAVGKVTLSGANNAISVTAPTGINYLNTSKGALDDGTSFLCNPSESLRVYMCLESGGSCTPKYQGSTTYTNTAVQGGITAPNYLQTAALSSSQGYPTYSTSYDLGGCFSYDLYIHDSKFYNAPNYAFPMNLGNGNKGPIIFYNIEVANVGNGASFVGDAGEKLAGDVFEIVAWDSNAREMGQTKSISVINSTFYNSGSLNSAVTTYPGIISAFIGATEPTFTATFQNNIFVQPQNGQPFLAGTYGNPNTIITGDHNLCYGNATYSDCPAGWNTSGGQNKPPLFTANGTVIHDSAGTSGDIYTGFNLKPQSGSAAIDNGTSTASIGVTRDILGTSRPQNSIYDIGAYEFYTAPSVVTSVALSGVTLKGATVK